MSTTMVESLTLTRLKKLKKLLTKIEKTMLKNMLLKLRSQYREKIEDTTKEWEEQGKLFKPDVPRSNFVIVVSLPLVDRIKFLFTNTAKYRLTISQKNVIRFTQDPMVKRYDKRK